MTATEMTSEAWRGVGADLARRLWQWAEEAGAPDPPAELEPRTARLVVLARGGPVGPELTADEAAELALHVQHGYAAGWAERYRARSVRLTARYRYSGGGQS